MVDAIAIIPNETFRDQFHQFAHRYQINKINVFSSVATEVAYQEGAEWVDALLIYIQGNINLISGYLRKNINRVSLVESEGTFLAWLDFRELGLDPKELARFLAEEAGLALMYVLKGSGTKRYVI
jgi:cystathionine beta-lyase